MTEFCMSEHKKAMQSGGMRFGDATVGSFGICYSDMIVGAAKLELRRHLFTLVGLRS
jgi:hypothetical protein